MHDRDKCPSCGEPLPLNAEGLCPACALRLILQPEESAALDEQPLATIRYFGNYELLSEIARGGMGVVYRARQVSLNRLVALKIISGGAFASPESTRRFKIEAELAASLDHPNIVPVYEIGEHDGQHYFSMSLVKGKTLEEEIGGKPMSPRRGAELISTVARAVHFAHQRGILHRDLKPNNILIDEAGRPHLTDFGLAKLMHGDSSLTRTKAVMGTPAYMAPEQARGAARSATIFTDVYSIGAVLYHCLTGKPPFAGENPIEIIRQVAETDPKRPSAIYSNVDRDLEIICLKCLEKESQRRYPSALALAEDLDRWSAGEPIQARPATPIEVAVKFVRRHPVPSALAATAVVTFLTGAVLVALQWRRAETALGIARERLYAADIHLAQQALEEHDRGRVLKLLNAHVPDAGEPDLRGMEWRYLWSQAQGNEDKLFTSSSRSAALWLEFSPDGHSLAIGAGPGKCEIWDVSAGVRKRNLTQPYPVTCASFDSKGARLVTISEGGLVTLWRVDSGEVVWSREITDPFQAQFLRDDQTIVLAISQGIGYPTGGRAVILSAQTGETLQDLAGSTGRALAVSPDKSVFVTGSKDGAIQLWSGEQPRLLRILTNSLDVVSLAFTPNGQRLVGGCWDGYLQEWEVSSGKWLRNLKAHRTHVWAVAIGKDGTLYTASGDHTSRAWDGDTWTEKLNFFGHRSVVFAIAVSPQADWLAASSAGQTRLWKIGGSERAAANHKSMPYRWADPAMAVGDKLILQSLQGPTVVDRATGKELRTYGTQAIAYDFFNDRQHLLLKVNDTNNPVAIWNFETGEQRVVTLEGFMVERPEYRLKSYAFGQIISVSSNAVVWDAASGKRIREFKALDARIYGWEISPDRKFLVAGGSRSGKGVANVISLPDGAIRSTFSLGATVEMVVFNKSGTMMAVASWDHSVYLFSFPDLQRRTRLQGQLGSIYHVAFTSDGQLLSGSEDGRTVLWDLRSSLEMMRFPHRYCSTMEDGTWVLGSEVDPRTHEIELRFVSAPSLEEIKTRQGF